MFRKASLVVASSLILFASPSNAEVKTPQLANARARTVINGHRLSNSYGYITNEESCTAPNFYNRFRHSVPAPMGHLESHTGALSSSTVAVNDDHPYLNFGDRVQVIGLGAKIVTDRLGTPNHFQLDHFNESGSCTLTDIGNLQTLKIW